MNKNFVAKPSYEALALTSGVTLLVAALLYGIFQISLLSNELKNTRSSLASSTAEMVDLNAKYREIKDENQSLNDVLSDTQKEKVSLEREKRRNEREIDTLTKLTTIDPELLKKYSKIYFLNENYIPPSLSNIDTRYLANPLRPLQILDEVEPFLDNMLKKANVDGVSLRVVSSYRSFAEQRSLKNTYVVTYGVGANSFSAEQGYSEHQLGTAVDFGTPVYLGATDGFRTTTAYQWLLDNAHRYGFILSYPPGNTFYKYEPWHWRFVGEDLAKDLYADGKYFYDLDQREIDEYLIKIFD